MWNKCRTILLDTESKSNISIGNRIPNLIYHKEATDNAYNLKHLYIISEDKIKEGDTIIDIINKANLGYIQSFPVLKSQLEMSAISNYRKLVAIQSQIPQQFIEQYITEYNKGNIISDVLVEYEGIEWLDKPLKYFPITNKDNTINIKTVKDSFNRSEVEVLLFNLAEHYAMTSTKSEIDDFNTWIEQNL